MNSSTLKELLTFIKFALTGVLNTLVDYGVFTLLTVIFGVNIYLSQVVSYSCGIINSFLINRSWTFKSKDNLISPTTVKFIIANILTLIISLPLLHFFGVYLGINNLIAKLITTAFTMVINFLLTRLWVFKEKKTQ